MDECFPEPLFEQMKEQKDYMQSNSVTVEARSKEREEDRVFFRQMMGMMSQTTMGMAQMLVSTRRWPRISTNPGV